MVLPGKDHCDYMYFISCCLLYQGVISWPHERLIPHAQSSQKESFSPDVTFFSDPYGLAASSSSVWGGTSRSVRSIS